MSGAAWLCLGIVALGVLLCVYHTGYYRGYAEAQCKKRQAATARAAGRQQRAEMAAAEFIDQERRRALAAERAIDELYARALRQLERIDPGRVPRRNHE